MDPLHALMDAYQSATQTYLGDAVEVGHSIFRRLAALELVVFGLIVALRSRFSGAAAILPELAWKLFLIAWLLTALLLYPFWMPFITPSFTEIAQSLTGFSSLNPAEVVAHGIALALIVLGTGIAQGLFLGGFLGALVGWFAAIAILVAFVAMAAIIAKTLIESWIVLATGPFFLSFSPFRLTAQLADNFIVYAFQVGIKLFFLIILVRVGSEVARRWAVELATASLFNFQVAFEIAAGAAILALVLWQIPTKMAEFLTRNWTLGIRQGLTE